MPNFGTVDFSQIWSVVSAMVTALQVPISLMVGFSVASYAIKAISTALDSAHERAEDAKHAAIDAEILAIDGVSSESGVLGWFSPWSPPDSALGARSGSLEDFLDDYEISAGNADRFAEGF